ncbi:hypothetical protein GGI22_006603, partial [Coemansia erecta]
LIVDKGGKVVLGDILEEEGAKTASKLNNRGHGPRVAIFQKCDVRALDDIARLVSAAQAEFGCLDIMVNNAGIGGTLLWADPDSSSLSRIIDINLRAPVEGTRLAVKYFMDNRRAGCVVNVASMMAFFPMEFDPVYGATKSGVVNLTASCATLALMDPPIHVNVVAPNYADTAMVQGMAEGGASSLLKKNGVLTVDEVVEQMIRCIEDESLSGDCIKLLPDRPPLVHKGRKAVSTGIVTQAAKL